MFGISRSGSFVLGGRRVRRLGYGAMQLAGTGVFEPRKDRGAALAVLRDAIAKVSVRRGADGAWLPAFSSDELTQAVHDNLPNLGLDVLDVVNLRSMFSVHHPAEGSLEAPLTVGNASSAAAPRSGWRRSSAYRAR
jgi:pyridoxine 4-dehydrogenase